MACCLRPPGGATGYRKDEREGASPFQPPRSGALPES